MTNTTGTQTATIVNTYPTVEAVLALHGYASMDDAREDMVAFGCHGCGSIASVSATNEMERREQASYVGWYCCETADNFIL